MRVDHIADGDHGAHHEQSTGNALAGNIRNQECQMCVINQEEIIEVTADLFSRIHGRIHIKFLPFGERREDIGQRVCLDS